MRRSGKDGVAVIGSLTLLVSNWKYHGEAKDVEIPAAGDTGTARTALRGDWTADVEAVYNIGAFPDATALIGTEVSLALKDAPSSTDVSIAKTGELQKADIENDINQGNKLMMTVVCNSGTDTASI